MEHVLYTLVEIGSDVVRYVGYTGGTLEKRLTQHKKDRTASYKTNWIASVGFCIEAVILESGFPDKETALEREIDYIKAYRFMQDNLTNTSSGGDGHGGCKHTQATKDKLSDMNRGKVLSPEHRRKMSESRTGLKRNEATKALFSANKLGEKNPMFGKTGSLSSCSLRVYQYTMDGTFVTEWNGASEAARGTACTQGHISSCCRGKRNQTNGFRWTYIKDQLIPLSKNAKFAWSGIY